MIYNIYDNRLVNSVRRNTYKKKGSNFLYIKIENFMIKLSYLKNCDIFQKGGGDDDETYQEHIERVKKEKEESIEYKGLNEKYIIGSEIKLLELRDILKEFINSDLLPIFTHCRSVKNEELILASITEYLMKTYKFINIRGNEGDYKIQTLFNIKMLLSCLLYSYLNYSIDDIIYIDNLKYINLLLSQLEENAITGIYKYTDKLDHDNPYGFNQLNIFAFIIFVINRFNNNHKIKLLQYFNSDDYDIEVDDDIGLFEENKKMYVNYLFSSDKLFHNSNLLGKIALIKICNSLITHMNNHILKEIKSSSPRSSRSSPSSRNPRSPNTKKRRI